MAFTRTITVEPGQTVPDLAIQHCGDASAMLAIADMNNISPTAYLQPGLKLLVPEPINKKMVEKIQAMGLKPASAANEDISDPQGIGYWIIGGATKTFRVS